MRISTEYGPDGTTLVRTIDDNGDGTGTITEYPSGITSVCEMAIPVQEPLDPIGTLATLLVVDGVLTLTDAALAIRQSEQALIAEAEAWSLG